MQRWEGPGGTALAGRSGQEDLVSRGRNAVWVDVDLIPHPLAQVLEGPPGCPSPGLGREKPWGPWAVWEAGRRLRTGNTGPELHAPFPSSRDIVDETL